MLSSYLPLAGCALPQSRTHFVRKPAGSGIRSKRVQTRAVLREFSNSTAAEPMVVPFEPDSDHLAAWKPESWKQRTAHQQPNYQDQQKLTDAVDTIARMPPLVFAGECRNLQTRLAKCATGEAFLMQGKFYSCWMNMPALYCYTPYANNPLDRMVVSRCATLIYIVLIDSTFILGYLQPESGHGEFSTSEPLLAYQYPELVLFRGQCR